MAALAAVAEAWGAQWEAGQWETRQWEAAQSEIRQWETEDRDAEEWAAKERGAGDRATGEAATGGPAAAGGRLTMPVLAGIRRGYARGHVHLYPQGSATRLLYEVDELHLHVQPAALVILLLSAVGGLLTVIWPFFPELLPVAPFGALLALGGWFLVVSRLQNSGPRELLDLVRDELSGGAGEGSEGGPDAGNGVPPSPVGTSARVP